MKTLWGFAFPCMERVPVDIRGTWNYERRRWSGVAENPDRRMVAMVFARHPEGIEWIKSDARDMEGLPVEIGFFTNGPDFRDATVFFHVGSASAALYAVLPSSSYLPEIPEHRLLETGQILRLASVEGEPEIEFGAIFLVREDVKFGRKHIWRLRDHLLSAVPAPFSSVLARGRHGSLPTL
jgi:hypothetical protein